jgi:hypothetical protein
MKNRKYIYFCILFFEMTISLSNYSKNIFILYFYLCSTKHMDDFASFFLT